MLSTSKLYEESHILLITLAERIVFGSSVEEVTNTNFCVASVEGLQLNVIFPFSVGLIVKKFPFVAVPSVDGICDGITPLFPEFQVHVVLPSFWLPNVTVTPSKTT